jgi:hypothetical protein
VKSVRLSGLVFLSFGNRGWCSFVSQVGQQFIDVLEVICAQSKLVPNFSLAHGWTILD